VTINRFHFKFDREKVKNGFKKITLSSLIGFLVGIIVLLFDLALYGLIGLVAFLIFG